MKNIIKLDGSAAKICYMPFKQYQLTSKIENKSKTNLQKSAYVGTESLHKSVVMDTNDIHAVYDSVAHITKYHCCNIWSWRNEEGARNSRIFRQI